MTFKIGDKVRSTGMNMEFEIVDCPEEHVWVKNATGVVYGRRSDDLVASLDPITDARGVEIHKGDTFYNTDASYSHTLTSEPSCDTFGNGKGGKQEHILVLR